VTNTRPNDLRIALTCGCTVRARVDPMPRMKLACQQGHGYQLHWTSVTYRDGRVIENNLMRKTT
jgi:hypothetical protein